MKNIILTFSFAFSCISSLCVGGALGYQQVVSVLPSGAVGQQPVFSTFPLTGSGQQIYVQQQQPASLLQIVRKQPQFGLNAQGGLTPVVGQSVVGSTGQFHPSTIGQVYNTAGGLGINQPFVISTNGGGLTGASVLPYPYNNIGGFTTAIVNGVPVLVASSPSAISGLGLGLSGLPVQSQLLQQPLVSLNPVVRQVSEEEEEFDPLDAALLDMENKGQMHMEKYAWGRRSPLLEKLPPKTVPGENHSMNDGIRELRSNVPLYYNTLPSVGGMGSSSPPMSNRMRNPPNPFVDAMGKRKKHFELYQYFRNLDLSQPQILVPTGTVPI